MFQKIKSAVVDSTTEKVQDVLNDYKRSLPYFEKLGLTCQGLSFSMSIIPEISATFVGSPNLLDSEKLSVVEEEEDLPKLISALLSMLKTASNLNDQMNATKLDRLKVEIKLGLPPKITISLF